MGEIMFSAESDAVSAFMKVSEVARRMGIGTSTVWKWASSNPAFPKPRRLSGRCSRWLRSEVEAYVSHFSGEGGRES